MGVRKLFNCWIDKLANLLKKIFPLDSRGRFLLKRLRAALFKLVDPDVRTGRQLGRLLPNLESWAYERSGSIFLVISPVRFREDEGQRATNFTQELVQRGIGVLFVYWRWPGQEIVPADSNSGILQIPMDVFLRKPELILRSFNRIKKNILIEYPHPDLFGPLSTAQAAGWITVYDLVDDWAAFQRVGQAAWYDPAFERYLLLHADIVLAVRQNLVDRVISRTGRHAVLVPNGLVPDIDTIDRPRYLEQGQITLGYFGYLSDAWFDWPLLLEVAERHPAWRIYLIGYGMSLEPGLLPENIVFLGKKPRSELASYAANWDVAIVPFKQGGVARGADPIKTYEYLAMDLPVVASGVQPPSGAEEHVLCARNSLEFARLVEKAAASSTEPDRCRFAGSCTWEERLNLLFSAMAESPRVRQKKFLFGGVL
jgi:glycosyltransferase involved in cell wall biosynthesis